MLIRVLPHSTTQHLQTQQVNIRIRVAQQAHNGPSGDGQLEVLDANATLVATHNFSLHPGQNWVSRPVAIGGQAAPHHFRVRNVGAVEIEVDY